VYEYVLVNCLVALQRHFAQHDFKLRGVAAVSLVSAC